MQYKAGNIVYVNKKMLIRYGLFELISKPFKIAYKFVAAGVTAFILTLTIDSTVELYVTEDDLEDQYTQLSKFIRKAVHNES